MGALSCVIGSDGKHKLQCVGSSRLVATVTHPTGVELAKVPPFPLATNLGPTGKDTERPVSQHEFALSRMLFRFTMLLCLRPDCACDVISVAT
jgi:hypothetical protein